MTSMFALWAGTLLTLGGPVTEVTITPMASETSVLIAVDGAITHRDFTMEGPHRLVLDLMGATHALPRADFDAVNRGGIIGVRTSQYADDIVRVVFVLDRRLDYTVIPDPRGLRISLENPVGDFEPWSSGATSAPFDPTALVPVSDQQQLQAAQEARRISITWTGASINEVLLTFAAFSGRSIVPGADVAGTVTADINDQPWDVALRAVLAGQGLTAVEEESGIIRVDDIETLSTRETTDPIFTSTYPVSYAVASEIQAAIADFSTDRGNVTVTAGSNTLIVSDIQRVHDAVTTLLGDLDRQTPQVSISAKIIFVNRTDLDEFGVSYELKDSRGNQINSLAPGAADLDGDGTIDQVDPGTNVVTLSGNSIAALGNGTQRVAGPSLSLLTSLVMGRHSLLAFIDALQAVQLSDIEATPQVTVLDHQPADLLVGELTPIRLVDPGSVGGAGPSAQVQQQETGIKLQVTPHVTADNQILLEVLAERSAAELADSDAGFIFRTQRVTTRVLVEDGETTVAGGLTQTEHSEALAGIPLLMDLPIIGALFRTRRESDIQRDLIILVTPHIVRAGS